jgi:hypothetical protein
VKRFATPLALIPAVLCVLAARDSGAQHTPVSAADAGASVSPSAPECQQRLLAYRGEQLRSSDRRATLRAWAARLLACAGDASVGAEALDDVANLIPTDDANDAQAFASAVVTAGLMRAAPTPSEVTVEQVRQRIARAGLANWFPDGVRNSVCHHASGQPVASYVCRRYGRCLGACQQEEFVVELTLGAHGFRVTSHRMDRADTGACGACE